jgi:ABC-type multidrug transport system fused ATPase/permease subunit
MNRNLYLTVYGLLGLFQSVFIMLGVTVLSVGTLNAATKLHGTMLERILRSPMAFFDTTPIGRILNRFSKDIDTVDVSSISTLSWFLGILNVIIMAKGNDRFRS